MMNILILGSKEFPFHSSHKYDKYAGGGIEIYVEKLSKYLVNRGHNVFIVTRSFPNQKRIDIQNKLKIFRTKFIYNKYLRNFSYNFLSIFISLKIIKKYRIDIIHCNGPVSGFFGVIIRLLTNKKMVFTPHGTITGWSFPFSHFLKLFEIISLKKASKVIYVSNITKNEIDKYVRNTSILIPNAVDIENYKPLKKKNEKVFVFGFIGRLEKVKGLEILLESFFRFVILYPNTKLLIAGEGSLKEFIINFIKNKELENKVEVVGWVKDVPSFLKDIDVFLLPSKEKGQPFALLEAMAAGKIVITSLPYIKHMKTGIKCQSNVNDLLDKMNSVYNERERMDFLCFNARKEIIEKYSWDDRIKKILKIYSELL